MKRKLAMILSIVMALQSIPVDVMAVSEMPESEEVDISLEEETNYLDTAIEETENIDTNGIEEESIVLDETPYGTEENIVFDEASEKTEEETTVFDEILEETEEETTVFDEILEETEEETTVFDETLEETEEETAVFDETLEETEEESAVLDESEEETLETDSLLTIIDETETEESRSESEVEKGESDLQEEEQAEIFDIQFQKIWYQYWNSDEQEEIQPEKTESYDLQDDTVDEIWCLDFTSLSASDIEKIGMNLTLISKEDRRVYAGDEVVLELPEQYLQWKLEEQASDSPNPGITYTGEDNKVKVVFQEEHILKSGEIFGNIELSAKLKTEQMDVEENMETSIMFAKKQLAILKLPACEVQEDIMQDDVTREMGKNIAWQVKSGWYQYTGVKEVEKIQPERFGDQNAILLGETSADNIWYLDYSSIRAVDVEKIGIDMALSFAEDTDVLAGEEIKLVLPDTYLMWEQIENKEFLGQDAEKTKIAYSVDDNELKLCFTEEQQFKAGEILENIVLSADINKEKLDVEQSVYENISYGDTTIATLTLPAYLLPDGIEQNCMIVTEEQEESALAWKIQIGTEKSGIPLAGYRIADEFDIEELPIAKVTGEDGKEIPFETTENGMIINIPEGSTTPYNVYVTHKINVEIAEKEIKTFENQVTLEKDDMQPDEEYVWTSMDTAVVTCAEQKLDWNEFYAMRMQEYDVTGKNEDQLKKLYLVISKEYDSYCEGYREKEEEQQKYILLNSELETETQIETYEARSYGYARISNTYIEAAVSDRGRFTIGNKEGDPAYDSDNNQILLYGHPDPGTSETLIMVDGEEYWFEANRIQESGNQIVAVMDVGNTGVKIYQRLSLVAVNESVENCIKIQYDIQNNSSEVRNVGIRIMIDTMLADNDDAPFKIPGKGNVTTSATYTGNNIPKYYQVYDNLDNPTTLASGYLIIDGERKPDKVSFLNWGSIRGSDWNYSIRDGSYLGDSAVAIWFNPVAVGAGSSANVATRYGTGIGKKGQVTGMPAIASDECALKVVDASSGDPIEEASVTAGQKVQKTDVSGYVVVKATEVNNKDILVTKEGYQDRTVNQEMLGGHQYNLEIKKNGDSMPIIQSVMLGNTNLLKTQMEFTQDTSGVLDKDSNKDKVYTVDIKAYTDSSECTYALYQGNTQIGKRNKNGVFSLKAMDSNKKDGTYIESLAAGERFYIKCFSKDGKSTKKQILLKIHSPKLAFDVSGITDATFNLLPGMDGSVENLLVQLISDSPSKFTIENSPLNMEVDLDIENKTLRIGLNCKKEMLQNTEARNWFRKAIHKYKGDGKKNGLTTDEKKDFDKFVKGWEKRQSRYKVGKFDLNGSIMGYGEFKITDDGLATGDFGIVGGIYANGSYTNNFWMWSLPCYATIGGEGKVELGLGGQMDFENANGFWDKLYEILDEITAYIGAYGELGLGHDYGGTAALKIGGKIKAGLEYLYNFKTNYNKLAVKGNLSLEAKALIWEKSFDLAEAQWNIFEGYTNSKTQSLSLNQEESVVMNEENVEFEDYFDELMSQPTTMESRDYLTLNTSEKSRAVKDDETLTNVYTSASPTVVTVGDKMYRFWLEDIVERAPQNRTALVYSVHENGVWSDSIIVEDDGTADFAYACVVDGTDIYVVWQDCSKIYGDTVSLQEMGQGLDLTMARIDTTRNISDTVSGIEVQTVTKDTVLDQLPAIYVSNGNGYIAWNTITSSYFEEIQGNCLKYRKYSNGSLGGVTVVNLSEQMMNTLKLLKENTGVKAIYSLSNWDDQIEQNTKKTYYITLENTAEPKEVNAGMDSDRTIKMDGITMMFWYEDGNIYYVPESVEMNENQKKTVFEKSIPSDLSEEFDVVIKSGVPVISWVTSVSDADQTKNIMAVEYVDGRWSLPFIMYEDIGSGTVTNFMTTVDADEKLHLSWQRTAYDENGTLTASEIKDILVDTWTDMEITDITVGEGSEDSTGMVLPLTVKVKNNGNTEINEFTIYVENEETQVFTGQHLTPGTEKEVKIEYTVQADYVKEYYVTVYTNDDRNEENNKISFKAGGTELSIVEHGTGIQYEQEALMLEICNLSNVEAKNVKMRLMDSQEDGTVLFENSVASLAGKSSMYMSVPVSVFDDVNVAYAYLFTDTEQKNEMPPMVLTYSNAMFYEAVSSAFTILCGEDGYVNVANYNDTYRSGEQIELKAEPEEGYVFWNWEITPKEENIGIIEDEQSAETVLTMPDNPLTVTAVFRKIKKSDRLSCDKENIEISVGETMTLTTSVEPIDTSDHFRWNSTDTSVVSVNRSGVVKGISAGTAVVEVHCGDLTATCEVTVKDIPIEKIEMPEEVRYINGIGITEKIDLLLTPENASEKVLWNSSDSDIATVDQEGIITTKAVGETVITAVSEKNPEITCSCRVKVQAELEEIVLSSNIITLKKNDTDEVHVSFIPADANNIPDVEWNVYDNSVLEVTTLGEHNEQAVIQAVGGGNTTIEVRAGRCTAYCTVTVTVPCEKIVMEQEQVTINVGRYKTLYYSLLPGTSTDNITWESSDTSVVTVGDDGEIYGVREGNAVVTAEAESGVKASCRVTVNSNVHKVNSIKDFQSPHDYLSNMDEIWLYEARTGEKGISVTFSEDTYTESGYDRIYIYDQDDNEIGVYEGNKLASQTVYVTGNVIKVRLVSDNVDEYYGFKVTNISVDHAKTKLPGKKATCLAKGLTEGESCSACGKVIKVQTEIPKLQHVVAKRPAREATCLVGGLTEGQYCSRCGKVLKAQKEIAKLKPTIKLNEQSLTLKVQQSTSALKVSGLAKGDYVKSWKSSNTKVVRVTKSGKITAQKKTGKANIRVTLASGLYKDIKITVQKSAVKTTSITGLKKKVTLSVTKKMQLNPVRKPITSQEKLTFKSSDKKIVKVTSKGVMVAQKAGKAQVTVQSGKKKYVITVTVTAPKPTGIKNIKNSLALKKGKTFTLRPILCPNGAQAKISYKTSNKKVVSVDAKGKIKANKKGNAVITITAGSIKKKCKITVK